MAITLLTAGFAMGDAGQKGFSTPAQLRETVLAVGYAAVFFLAVLGAIAAAGEYRHGTISQRFLASPARGRVLAAKLTAYSIVGAGTAVVVTAVATVLGQAVVSSKGYTLDLASGGARMAAGIVVATVLAGLLGVIVGFITRNPTTALVAVFGGWIGEKIAGDWLGTAAQYLPFHLVENVLGLTPSLAFGYAVLALAGITAALGVVALKVFAPRDVT
jgi:ABC-2 type transport system permease protein